MRVRDLTGRCAKVGHVLLGCCLFGSVTLAHAEQPTTDTHPDVTAALSYTVPEHRCRHPEQTADYKRVEGSERIASRDHTNAAIQYGTLEDSSTRLRRAREDRNYTRCMVRYRKVLYQDFETLRDSARHGLTQTQANIILGHMASVQRAMEGSHAEAQRR